jgi:hypothetical protein
MDKYRGYAIGGAVLGCLALLVASWPATPDRATGRIIAVAAAVNSQRQAPAPTPQVTQAATDTRPVIAPPTPDHRLDRPPSISAGQIDQVLAAYHSPAIGTGAVFYDLGLRYGVDPAYALAFYIVESHAGTRGVARFTHAIGNIRTTPGYRDYEGYRAYDTYAEGIEDWFKLLKELYIDGWHLATPVTILPRYAPWGDNNDPLTYANTVTRLVDSWQQSK